MIFKAQLEPDLDELLQKVDSLKASCEAVQGSAKLQALLKIVLHGNALNTVEFVQNNAPEMRRVTALLPTLAQVLRAPLIEESKKGHFTPPAVNRPLASRSRSCAPRTPTSIEDWTCWSAS